MNTSTKVKSKTEFSQVWLLLFSDRAFVLPIETVTVAGHDVLVRTVEVATLAFAAFRPARVLADHDCSAAAGFLNRLDGFAVTGFDVVRRHVLTVLNEVVNPVLDSSQVFRGLFRDAFSEVFREAVGSARFLWHCLVNTALA